VTYFERRVGRLVEIRRDEQPEARNPSFTRVAELAKELGRDVRVVTIADWRRARALPADRAQRVETSIRTFLSRCDRVCWLLCEDRIARMQFERIVEKLVDERCRTANTTAEAIDWLAPALNAAELARLKQFLDGGAA
jgi:hypothetical protein